MALGTKFKDGKDTGVPAIVVYVSRKVAAEYLFAEHLIPIDIEGVPTDVVEFAPTTWKAGKTAVSEKHPLEQKRLLGVPKPPKVIMSSITAGNPAQSIEVDWLTFFSAIQNQANCGSCVAFGDIGVWEAVYRIVANNPADPIKLSEAAKECPWQTYAEKA